MPEATLDDVMRMRRHYFGKISFVDHQIGKVLQALEEAGQLENSIVVFSSDHGEMLGDHGSAYKWLMYESITRVPLVVKDFRQSGPSTRIDDLVSLMDLGPTFLEWAEAPVPTRLEGRSLGPYLRGEPIEPRTAVFCEDNYMVMMRKADEKIVHYLGAPYGEYYRLTEDPDETRNLWDDPDCLETRRALQLELLDWLASSTYHHGGHKTCNGRKSEYPIRWHSESEHGIHGGNYKPKGDRYF
jgi:arylsulfatase A-like enzyme